LCTPAPARNLDLAALDVPADRCVRAFEACRVARDSMIVNEKGTLHVLRLLLALPPARR
jgi:hypothetical protein